MAGLLDFLQSASNASASTVSGPVDMLSWLLQKAGVPVGNAPPGSSAWMEQKGLTKPVKQSAASLAGETVGLLSPTVAAAKAPQIAKGLLQVADNAAAPSLLRNDKGAIDIEALKRAFPELDLMLSQKADRVSLDKVVVPKEARNQGMGSDFMAALTKAADEDGARIGLTPSSEFGGNKARLIEFYKRHGFVPNKGKNRDFEFMAGMVRQPE